MANRYLSLSGPSPNSHWKPLPPFHLAYVDTVTLSAPFSTPFGILTYGESGAAGHLERAAVDTGAEVGRAHVGAVVAVAAGVTGDGAAGLVEVVVQQQVGRDVRAPDTVASARTGIAAPSGRLPVTVNVPACAYGDAGTSSQVTATGRVDAVGVRGDDGGRQRPGRARSVVFTDTSSTSATSWSGW